MAHKAKAAGAVVEALVGLRSVGGATCRTNGFAHTGEAVVVLILKDFIPRNVEAGGVGQVKDVEAVLQVITFLEVGHLDDRYVCPPLRSLAEDIALTGSEVRLKGISGRYSGKLGAG